MKSQHDPSTGTPVALDPIPKWAGAFTVGAIAMLIVIRVVLEKK